MNYHAAFWYVGSASTFAIGLVYLFACPAYPELWSLLFKFKPVPETKLLLGLVGASFLSVSGIFCVVAANGDRHFRAKINKSGVIGTFILLAFIIWENQYVKLYQPMWSSCIIGMLSVFLLLGIVNLANGGGGSHAPKVPRAKKA
eukprot:tig00020556_g10982.t1